jgi:hypothetical protein
MHESFENFHSANNVKMNTLYNKSLPLPYAISKGEGLIIEEML